MNVALYPQHLNLISLCTGGGGLDLGVELAIPDARSVVLVEGEAWSVATLVSAMESGLMAPAPVWSDVRTFDGRPWRGLVDGLIGGIPCQPHSLAGKRLGEDDERDLWSPARRIIVQSRPWFVLIENVRGMLSAAEGLEPGAFRVWRDLQRIGYEVEFGIFTAEEVGASHERQRVFILAVADCGRDGEQRWRRAAEFPCSPRGIEVERDQRKRRGHAACDSGEAVADTDGWRHRTRSGGNTEPAHACQSSEDMEHASRDGRREGRAEPDLRSRRHTASSASAELVNAFSGGHDGIAQDPIGRPLERAATERSSRDSFPALYPPGPSDLDGWRRVLENSPELEPAVRRMADGVAARLDLTGPHAARIERLRMLGNGVVPLQAAYALRTLATRLARRSAGAAALVRMMEQ